MKHWVAMAFALAMVANCAAQESLPTVQTEGELKFASDSRGNRMPDYSYCGYRASEEPLPDVATRLRINPSGRDDTLRLQEALEKLAALPADANGWHGALELGPGSFHVEDALALRHSGIVLRGSLDGQGQRLTTIYATGKARRALITVGNNLPARLDHSNEMALSVTVPVGFKTIKYPGSNKGVALSAGQQISIEVKSTQSWIAALGMDRFPSDDGKGSWLDWKPGTLNQYIRRAIKRVNDGEIELDAPITCGLDAEQTPMVIRPVLQSHATERIGIEQLTLISQADRATNPKDEEHAWDAIRILNAEDVWVRGIECRQFVGSAVRVSRHARRVSVVDCRCYDPVSEDAGWRRRSFVTAGSQTLFLRCRSEDGRNDFCTEDLAAGPNAFVACQAVRAARSSGPIGSWCTGVLYDNVELDGAALELNNLETESQGIGWAAANCTLWNCIAPKHIVRRPPTAYNWAVGVWGEFTGDGLWAHLNEFVSPDSLYEYQLSRRIGKASAQNVLNASLNRHASTSEAPLFASSVTTPPVASARSWLRIDDGRILMEEQPGEAGSALLSNPLVGTRLQLSWWRGSVLPDKVAEFGPSLTRFVPGHDERFYTDELADVIDMMEAAGHVAIDHHWGLWYDRRRVDHQMIRRMDGEVWAPFFEMPWSRSGIGSAYDGLSKYDLTRFNPWYFGRLKEFARLADQRGVVLMQHMYFQHNILEAGAHWAEFPWRPANCLQPTGFLEPPEYVNRKRIFMADDFYDVTHPVRRDLHTRYIRHCLNELGANHNVMFLLGEEFTGPEHFVRFWLETIQKWQRETDRDVHVVLSTTRDVQEAVLKDTELQKIVDAVEIKYWWYSEDGSLYDPPGGQNLAPRQQNREWKGNKKRSAESISRSVEEVRMRYPGKAVITAFPEVPAFAP